ncbi:hypothetical protein BKA58DRAFT_405028 [Alternaria rosae]|uniref:uncharacterized protein n=1 Tax=Alternaria rosae TaxID=1187941 RepID=UPI001E8E5F7A|nr:uncharacterized protein BKA58DRAFT_405028 [Alternaria rosae]KAH6865274.1 hypothetical protein BKA58DRAFT_405028 [Alternaria rosae]
MASIQPIYTITASLKTYKTEDVESPDLEDECYVCMRPFDHVDNEDDPNELPCKAVRLLPCGHLIGSECLKMTTSKLNMANCSLCAVPLAVKHASPMNHAMCCLLSNCYTKTLVDHALLVGSVLAGPQIASVPLLCRSHTQSHELKMALLSYAFFARQLTWADAFSFWLYYMKLVFVSLGGVTLFLLSIGLLKRLDDLYGAPIEMFFLSTLLSTDCRIHLSETAMRMVVQALCIITGMSVQVAMVRQPRHQNTLAFMRGAAFLREALMILGCDVFIFVGVASVLTKTLEFVVMAVNITVLVSYGLRRRGKMFRYACGFMLAAVLIHLVNRFRPISFGESSRT